jgi:excisionase family DNA binding protein
VTKNPVIDALSGPTTTVQKAGELLGLSRNKAYEAAASGELPTLRFGKRIVVPTIPLKRMLGMEPA